MRLFVTDLDGTLNDADYRISQKNIDALKKLKDNDFVVVLATGRNIYSCFKVIDESFPIDFLIFSTGIGIVDFRDNKLIDFSYLSCNETYKIIELLDKTHHNFFVHQKPPENHLNFYRKKYECTDFEKRMNFYADFSQPLNHNWHFEASQFIVFVDNVEQYNALSAQINSFFPYLSQIRATSPFNHQTIWFEIYPQNVSKGSAIQKICDILNINKDKTFAIGNDYNDLDMLDFCANSFVVSNCPEELKNGKYNIVKSNVEDGVAEAIEMILL